MTKRRPTSSHADETPPNDDTQEVIVNAADPTDQTPQGEPTETELSEMAEALDQEAPTPDELAIQYSYQYLEKLISQLPDFAQMASWDMAMFQADRGELLEQYLEGINQLLQITRTTTFSSLADAKEFLVDVIQLCDTLPPVIVAFTLVKYHIRANRPN